MDRNGLRAATRRLRAPAQSGRAVAVALLSACLLMPGGCASLHHGRTQHVVVASDPPGARIFAGDEPVGVTPDVVTVNRSGTVLRLEKNGFRTQEIRMPRVPSAWLAGSVVLAVPFLLAGSHWVSGAALVLGVDFGTGAAWELPERVETALDPVVEAPARTPLGVTGGMDAEPGGSAGAGHR